MREYFAFCLVFLIIFDQSKSHPDRLRNRFRSRLLQHLENSGAGSGPLAARLQYQLKQRQGGNRIPDAWPPIRDAWPPILTNSQGAKEAALLAVPPPALPPLPAHPGALAGDPLFAAKAGTHAGRAPANQNRQPGTVVDIVKISLKPQGGEAGSAQAKQSPEEPGQRVRSRSRSAQRALQHNSKDKGDQEKENGSVGSAPDNQPRVQTPLRPLSGPNRPSVPRPPVGLSSQRRSEPKSGQNPYLELLRRSGYFERSYPWDRNAHQGQISNQRRSNLTLQQAEFRGRQGLGRVRPEEKSENKIRGAVPGGSLESIFPTVSKVEKQPADKAKQLIQPSQIEIAELKLPELPEEPGQIFKPLSQPKPTIQHNPSVQLNPTVQLLSALQPAVIADVKRARQPTYVPNAQPQESRDNTLRAYRAELKAWRESKRARRLENRN